MRRSSWVRHKGGRMFKKPLIIGIVVACVTGGGVIAANAQDTPAPEGNVPASAAPSEPLGASIGVLRRPAVGDDQLPEDARALLDHMHFAEADPAQAIQYQDARRVYDGAGQEVFLVPAGDHVCSTISNTFGVHSLCAAVDMIASGEHLPYSVQNTGHGQSVVGIAPDGVSDVSVTLGDGTHERIAVKSNVFVIDTDASLESVQWTDPAGSRHTDDSSKAAQAKLADVAAE